MRSTFLLTLATPCWVLSFPAGNAWTTAAVAFGTTTRRASRSRQRRHVPVSMSSQALSSSHDSSIQPRITPRKVVVVGAGIGGLSSAYDARHLLRPEDDIVVVSDRDHFHFTPSNPWVATRTRTVQDISLYLPDILPKHSIDFVHSAATQLDPVQQKLTLANGDSLDYDFLIAATGPRLAFEEIPGAGPDQFSTSVCTTPHASDAADAVDQLAANPGPVVVGAVQSASCFGPAYEFAFLLHFELHKKGGKALVDKCPMTFVTSEPYIGHLGLSGAGDSRKILEKLLRKKGIPWITNCKVNKITKESVSIEYLEENAGDSTLTKRTKTIPSKFNMLIPQFKGMDVWTSVPGLTDPSGMVLINQFQQSQSFPNIFAVGICVHMDAVETTPVPTGPPKTGYMIESMGTAAIKNIRNMIDQLEELNQDNDVVAMDTMELHEKPLLNALCITDFGDDGAIFLSLPQMPPRRMDLTIDGRVATLAKIAFEKYFLYKIRTGDTDPYYEKYMLHLIGVDRTIKV